MHERSPPRSMRISLPTAGSLPPGSKPAQPPVARAACGGARAARRRDCHRRCADRNAGDGLFPCRRCSTWPLPMIRAPQPAPNQPPRTVKALGYADEKQPTAVDAAFLALNANPARHSVWASAYGTRGTTEGDASVGSTDRFASVFGVAAGYDYRLRRTRRPASRSASGAYELPHHRWSRQWQQRRCCRWPFMARRTSAQRIWLVRSPTPTTAVSDDPHAPSPPPGTTFAASFDAHDFAARVEAGIHYGWLTPYAGRERPGLLHAGLPGRRVRLRVGLRAGL